MVDCRSWNWFLLIWYLTKWIAVNIVPGCDSHSAKSMSCIGISNLVESIHKIERVDFRCFSDPSICQPLIADLLKLSTGSFGNRT